MPNVEPCPFCGEIGKIYLGKDCGPAFAGMDAISHGKGPGSCPAFGMHTLKKWNARWEETDS